MNIDVYVLTLLSPAAREDEIGVGGSARSEAGATPILSLYLITSTELDFLYTL